MYTRHQQLLTEPQIIGLIRVLKADIENKDIRQDLILEGAKQHVLTRALNYLADGRDYYIKIAQQESEIEYPSFVDFVEYKTTCFLMLLDPDQCYVGEILIITNTLPGKVFHTESKKYFTLVSGTDEYSIWRREK